MNRAIILTAQCKFDVLFTEFPELTDDEELILELIERGQLVLKYASDRVKNMPNVVKAVVKEFKDQLQHASKKLRDDESFIKSIIKYVNTEYISERLRDNDDIILQLILYNERYCLFSRFDMGLVSKRLQNDKSLYLSVLKQLPTLCYIIPKTLLACTEFERDIKFTNVMVWRVLYDPVMLGRDFNKRYGQCVISV